MSERGLAAAPLRPGPGPAGRTGHVGGSLQWPIREPLPRSTAHRPADRRRRRHGRARLGGRGRPALPRGGEPPRARERRRGTHELHRGRGRADRDEHLRRKPAQARPRAPRRRFEEINSAGVRLAREAREVAGRDVFVAGSIGPLGELEVFDPSEHGPLYAAQATRPRGTWRRSVHGRDVLRPRGAVVAVEAVRWVSSLPIVALLTFDDDAEFTGGVGAAAAARRLAELDVAAIGTNHGAARRSRFARFAGCRTRGSRWRRFPTSAWRASPAAGSSTRTRRRTTSPSSPSRRSGSAPGSSAAAAARRRRRSRRCARRSTRAACREARSRSKSPS